jgi:hypothetical protein
MKMREAFENLTWHFTSNKQILTDAFECMAESACFSQLATCNGPPAKILVLPLSINRKHLFFFFIVDVL